MKVFISWSGEPSRQIALALRDWIPVVIQAVKPYMSEQDNEAGARWLDGVSTELDTTHFGIICVTPNNIDSRWVNFEAGALSKAVDRARVAPLLYGFDSLSDLVPPLSQFQAKLANVNGIRDLATSINEQMDESLPAAVLAESFRLAWPKLETALDAIGSSPSPHASPQRTQRDLLEEVLLLSRSNQIVLRGLRPRGDEAFVVSDRASNLRDEIRFTFRELGGKTDISDGEIHISGLHADDIDRFVLGRAEGIADAIGYKLKFYPHEPPF